MRWETPSGTDSGRCIEDPGIQQKLLRIVVWMERDPFAREDLMQEALVHFWLEHGRNPRHTLSWYFQSCKFHLQHVNARGRSVDSTRRAQTRIRPLAESDIQPVSTRDDSDRLLSEVSAHEIISLLSGGLDGRAQVVLGLLVEGMNTCEIARRIRISHAAVIKHRHKIAALAAKLGITPSAGPPSASSCSYS
jgi:DNA-directed RNA polymerase specialized sigma24 family protein